MNFKNKLNKILSEDGAEGVGLKLERLKARILKIIPEIEKNITTALDHAKAEYDIVGIDTVLYNRSWPNEDTLNTIKGLMPFFHCAKQSGVYCHVQLYDETLYIVTSRKELKDNQPEFDNSLDNMENNGEEKGVIYHGNGCAVVDLIMALTDHLKYLGWMKEDLPKSSNAQLFEDIQWFLRQFNKLSPELMSDDIMAILADLNRLAEDL